MARRLVAWGRSAPSGYPDYGLGLDFNPYTIDSWPVALATKEWASFSGGGGYVLAIDTEGYLWAWGVNNYGKLGVGDTTTRYEPVQVGSSKWLQVSTSLVISAGIDESGKLFSWGRGIGSDKYVPTLLDSGPWKKVVCRPGGILAIKADDSLWVIGLNSSGQLGVGTYSAVSTLTKVGTASWKDVNGGGMSASFGIQTDGSLWATGSNYYGHLGFGDVTTRNTFQKVSDGPWEDVSGVDRQTIGIGPGGVLYGWGLNNSSNPLGVGAGVGQALNGENLVVSPTVISSGPWISTVDSCQGETIAAIHSDGGLYAWGRNLAGIFYFPGGAPIYSMASPFRLGTGSCQRASMARNESSANVALILAYGDGFLAPPAFWTNFSGQSEIA